MFLTPTFCDFFSTPIGLGARTGQGHFPAVHIWATETHLHPGRDVGHSSCVTGTGTTAGGGPHPSTPVREDQLPLLCSRVEMTIIALIKYAAAMVPQLPGRDGAGRAPRQPHGMQDNWLPQVSGSGCPRRVAPPLGSGRHRGFAGKGPLCVMVALKRALLFRSVCGVPSPLPGPVWLLAGFTLLYLTCLPTFYTAPHSHCPPEQSSLP